MYLYVEIFDASGAYSDMMYGSSKPTFERSKVKKIKLTEEQEAELKVPKGYKLSVLSLQEE